MTMVDVPLGDITAEQTQVLLNPPVGMSPSIAVLSSIGDTTFAFQQLSSAELLGALRGSSETAKFVLTAVVECCREDSENYSKLTADDDIFTHLKSVLIRGDIDPFTKGKAAYLLTGIMSHAPGKYGEDTNDFSVVGAVTQSLTNGNTSTLGQLEGLCNLLKIPTFREAVLDQPGTLHVLLSVNANSASQTLYRAVFCLWLLSGGSGLTASARRVAELLKAILASCRSEKVVRVALMALRNLIKDETMVLAVVEAGGLESVRTLEYEKWRDAEMYAEIKDLAACLASEQSTHSSVAAYEKELESNELVPGYLHSERFWLDNVGKFDKDDFGPIRKLTTLLGSSNPTTLCLACSDLGEFARLHPLGKSVIGKLHAKAMVMPLMGHSDRQVAREALLCVQKMMLNQSSLNKMEAK
mmetsp:Transcript_15515/g.33755  ORF Transcript_15515/g.33755 Transcript_15515/m.33755 type:complete len:413 (+) Transcript_15515:82-1320(+)